MSDTMGIAAGYDKEPSRSLSLQADAYTENTWFDADLKKVIAKTWQWVCHVEKTRAPGSYVTVQIAGHSIAVVRDKSGALRAFYNECKHRAHGCRQTPLNSVRIIHRPCAELERHATFDAVLFGG